VRSSFHAGELFHADDIVSAGPSDDPQIGDWIALETR
jgi:hypothetical protein